MEDETMRNTTDSTCRQACWLRRQVLHGPPTKGDLAASVAAIEIGCKASGQTPNLRGERISAEVPWVQPRENGPSASGLADAARQDRPPGSSHRASCRPDGHRSRQGADQPGPGAKLGEAYPINDRSNWHTSPADFVVRAQNLRRFAVAHGGPKRMVHDTDGPQTCQKLIRK